MQTCPIAFRLSGSLTLVSLCPSNALSPMLSRPSENSTFSRGAPLNAILPIVFTDFGSSSDFRFAPENAACPISATPSGITTELIGFPPVLAGAKCSSSNLLNCSTIYYRRKFEIWIYSELCFSYLR